MRLSTAFLCTLLVVIALAGMWALIDGFAATADPALATGRPDAQVHAGPSLGAGALNAFGLDSRGLPGAKAATKGEVSSRHRVVRDGVELALRKLVDGVCLTEPRVRVIDPELPEPVLLNSGELISLARSPERSVQLESENEGWILERTELSIGPGREGPLEIPVRPKHRILVDLTAAGTYDWIHSAKLQGHWEQSGTGHRDRSAIFEVTSESGGYILEAPALDRGRVRIEALADGFRPDRSEWLRVESSSEWIEFSLALLSYETSTAEVLVTVKDQDETKLQGAWVSVFEEFESMPIVGVRVTDNSLKPLWDGVVDPDLMDKPPTAATIEGGLAGFALKAPGDYRIAAWNPGSGDLLSEVIHFEPGEKREITLTIGATSSLEGRILGSLADFRSSTVDRFGDLRLYNRNTGASYMTELRRDGGFRFDGLSPGDYQLSVTGAITGLNGNESMIPLLSRDVTVRSGEDAWIEVALGDSAPGQRLAGQVDFGVQMDQWAFMVGLVRLPDDPTAADETAAADSRQLIRAGSSGEFEFSAIEPGRYRVVSLGVRTDRRALAFLYQDVDLREGQAPPGPVLLAPLGEPLYLQLADPQADPRELSVRVEASDALNSFLIDQASELLVGNDFPSVFFGLPEGELTLRSDGEDLHLVVDRASIVLVP